MVAASSLARLSLHACPLGELGLGLGGLVLGFGLGLRFERRFGLADLAQAGVTSRQLCGKLVSAAASAEARLFLGIDALGFRQQALDLVLQLLLGFGHPAIAHRLVLGGVGPDLRTVDGDVAELDQPSSLTEPKHLYEQPAECLQMLLAKGRDGVVVGMLIAGQHPKWHLVVSRSLELARGRLADAVTVHQQFHHHRGVVTRPAAQILGIIHRADRRQIQAVDHVTHKQRQVSLGQP